MIFNRICREIIVLLSIFIEEIYRRQVITET